MTERPILFSGAMVRALLAGTKTQTRRILKVPHENPLGKWEVLPWGGPNGGRTRDGKTVPYQNVIGHTRTGEVIACPYGEPGERIWVREAFRFPESLDHLSPAQVGEKALAAGYPNPWCPTQFEADGSRRAPQEWRDFVTPPQANEAGRLRTGMHMPRWASRITLEITCVRVERLQDISETDAVAEGCSLNHNGYYWGGPHPVSGLKQLATAKGAYQDLWESINGPDSWDANPWVWAIEFRKVTL